MVNIINGTTKAKRRKFAVAFKVQLSLSAIRERKILAEFSKLFEVHLNVISKWEREFLERFGKIEQPFPVSLSKITQP